MSAKCKVWSGQAWNPAKLRSSPFLNRHFLEAESFQSKPVRTSPNEEDKASQVYQSSITLCYGWASGIFADLMQYEALPEPKDFGLRKGCGLLEKLGFASDGA